MDVKGSFYSLGDLIPPKGIPLTSSLLGAENAVVVYSTREKIGAMTITPRAILATVGEPPPGKISSWACGIAVGDYKRAFRAVSTDSDADVEITVDPGTNKVSIGGQSCQIVPGPLTGFLPFTTVPDGAVAVARLPLRAAATLLSAMADLVDAKLRVSGKDAERMVTMSVLPPASKTSQGMIVFHDAKGVADQEVIGTLGVDSASFLGSPDGPKGVDGR